MINVEKCIFGVPSIDFLGHSFDTAGVTPLPQYVSAVVDFPQPSTMKELQAFLGMLNFYRRFLPAIANILRPLTDSLRGGKKSDDRLEWSPAGAFLGFCQGGCTFLADLPPPPPESGSGSASRF